MDFVANFKELKSQVNLRQALTFEGLVGMVWTVARFFIRLCVEETRKARLTDHAIAVPRNHRQKKGLRLGCVFFIVPHFRLYVETVAVHSQQMELLCKILHFDVQ